MSAKFLLRCAVVSALVITSVGFAGSAWAAPPANDDIGGAVLIPNPLPFSTTENTLEATTSPEETAFESFCGVTIQQGVWFTATPAQDAVAAVDVTGSDYGAGILVATGTPGDLTPINCAQGRLAGPITGGQTYYLMIFGDGSTPATSGNLALDVAEAIILDVELVSPVEPLTFSLDVAGVACTPGTLAVQSVQAEDAPITPLSVTPDASNANRALMVLPSDTTPGALEVEASCSDGTQTVTADPGVVFWAGLAVTKSVGGTPPAGTTFTVHVSCPAEFDTSAIEADLNYPSAGGVRYVYSDTFRDNCVITEPVNGGASSVAINPDHLGLETPERFMATVTNSFDLVVIRPAFTG